MSDVADVELVYAEAPGADDEFALFDDEWVAVSNRCGAGRLADRELWLPPMSAPQERLALDWCAARGICRRRDGCAKMRQSSPGCRAAAVQPRFCHRTA
ncbi:MAG: hypothetical protein ACK5JR_12550 [Tropicimonas sp.]|uniref:hypothetical protein n=1 Tax=Tropicimonas sp. TaxID=2067044 RepID=UPI003A8B22AB